MPILTFQGWISILIETLLALFLIMKAPIVPKKPISNVWGSNISGQLGYGDISNRGDNNTSMGDNLSLVNLGTNLKVTQLSVGAFHSCAILDNLSTAAVETSLKCWGDNSIAQLGLETSVTIDQGDNSTDMGDNLSFVNIGTNLKITKVVAGGYHTCIIVDNTTTTAIEGKVKCWGSGQYGQLGYNDNATRGDNNSSMGDNLSFVDLGTNLKAIDLSLGTNNSCAILDNESTTDTVESLLKCWGRNNHGQLGQETAINRGDNASEMGDNLAFTELEITTSS